VWGRTEAILGPPCFITIRMCGRNERPRSRRRPNPRRAAGCRSGGARLGVRRAQATACPAGGITDHEGRSALNKLLLAASLALTGLLAAAAATLAAAAPALAATP